MKKKKLLFIAPIHKGGTYFFYEGICNYLKEHYSDLYNVQFIHSVSGYVLSYFSRADVIFSIIPYLRKPFFSKKYIFNLHGNYQTERKNKGIGNKLLYFSEVNLWFADTIMLTSYYLADKLGFREKYDRKIVIIPNYLSEDGYKNTQKLYDNSQYKILTVTNFTFYEKGKGIINLKNVLKGLSEQTNKHIIRTIVGNIDHSNFSLLKSELNKININNQTVNIKYVGWQNKNSIIDLYKYNDRFLYRTELDNYPTVVIEAMAYGMKVLVNNYESFGYFLGKRVICISEDDMINKIIENKPTLFSIKNIDEISGMVVKIIEQKT